MEEGQKRKVGRLKSKVIFPAPLPPPKRAEETMRIEFADSGRDGIYTVSTRNGIQVLENITQLSILSFNGLMFQ